MADSAAIVRVPVAEVAAEAYRGVFGRMGLFLEIAALPLLLLLAATLVPGYLLDHFVPAETLAGWGRGGDLDFGVTDIIAALFAVPCLNAFAVRWHHVVLFAGERALPRGLFRRAFGRFLLYTLLIYATAAALILGALTIAASGGIAGEAELPAPVATAAAVVVTLLASFVWYATLRCSLLFPAAAYGRPLAISAAWRALRGNSWRLVGCALLACAPFTLTIVFLFNALLAALHLDTASALAAPSLGLFILRGLVNTLSNFVLVALAASVLGGFYRRLALRGLGVF